MKTKEQIKVPKSTEDTLSNRETVDSAENHGSEEVRCAQPVVDAGLCGTGHWSGDGASIVFVEEQAGDVPRPGMSGRDFNSKGEKAPNNRER